MPTNVNNVLGVAAAAAGAATAAVEAPAGLVAPDLKAFLIYAGYGAAMGVIAALWRPEMRTGPKITLLTVTGGFVGGVSGAAFSEWSGAPNLALGVAIIASLLAPQFIVQPLQVLRDLKAIFFRKDI